MKVLVVQSRPYQAFVGGDGAYTDALVRHLEDLGCTVRGITSGTTKGRPRLWVTLAYRGTRNAPWRFRSTLRIGRFYLTLGPQLLRDTLDFLAARRRPSGLSVSPFAVPPGAREQAWISRQVAREKPDLVILSFEAAGAVDVVRQQGVPALALIGFLPIRSYALADARAVERANADDANGFIQAARRADWIAFSSIDDCNFARAELNVPAPLYIGMGMERMGQHARGDKPVVLFVGNKTEPNREAVAWFLNQVWPQVRSQVSDARFRIIGRVSHYFETSEDGGVECVGEVASLAEEYRGGRVVVAPLMTGSAGVKTKVAEAISCGCPIVSTSLGVDGADLGQIDPAGYIADDPPTFAARVLDLLTNQALWQEKQRGTTAVFDELFSSRAAYRQLDALIADTHSHGSAQPEPAAYGGTFT